MLAELISIGDELLIGQVTNTNASWLGSRLSSMGVQVRQVSSCGDTAEAITQCLNQATQRAGIIILTGGLGPTKDDITKQTLASFFGVELVQHPETLAQVKAMFASRGLPMPAANYQQAMVPANCTVLANRSGTAPGMWFTHKGHVYVSLPGVPFEMKTLFAEEVEPRIRQQFSLPAIVHKTLLTAGIGESVLAEKLSELEDRLPGHIKLAYLPGLSEVRLRLSGTGPDRNALEHEIELLAEGMKTQIGNYCYGEGADTLASYVNRHMTAAGQTLSVAESFTGGHLAHRITEVPGSSSYFMGGIVAYANAVKVNDLAVSSSTLNQFGSVSEACVKEMAEGCRTKFGTDWAIASTGVAGPSGGSHDKPVGTCYIGVAGPNWLQAKKFNLGNDRGRTIQRGAVLALDMLRRAMAGMPADH